MASAVTAVAHTRARADPWAPLPARGGELQRSGFHNRRFGALPRGLL
eukprot:CAMPEP_0198589424 /NCGR_PEP_ID=MMETSP1462-20131121/134376_1 /TAXON_ID=1333877 /ORGANISM="Brandtodinium nutriculum, Strain RCC3387" /LENGTH=46 /DNA_ID= /DNA_START= /DNA_END= /DNA_ORIENTATION=